MTRLLYIVTATMPDEATAREYVAWLEDGHIDQVIDGGAHSGMIVRLDGPPDAKPKIETHYVFATREVFDQYVAKHAPTLRAEGLRKFPPERGIVFERRLGEIV